VIKARGLDSRLRDRLLGLYLRGFGARWESIGVGGVGCEICISNY
jgi:hypothetical protein